MFVLKSNVKSLKRKGSRSDGGVAKKAKLQLERRRTRSQIAQDQLASAMQIKVDEEINTENLNPVERLHEEIPFSSDKATDNDEILGIESTEARRLQNIEDNANFLMQIGIVKTKDLMAASTHTKKKQLTKNKIVEIRKANIPPRRVSMRLQRIAPDGILLPDPPPKPVEQTEHGRKPAGALDMVKYIYNKESDDDCAVGSLKSAMRVQSSYKTMKLKNLDLDSYIDSLSKMALTKERVAKVVPQRVFSVVLHPATDNILAACGDKWGRLGLWFVEKSQPDGDNIMCFEPHTRPIAHINFHPENSGKLFSSSYDGTVRCMDVAKGVFDEMYATSEEEDFRISGFSFFSANTMVTAQGDGCVGIVDFRTPSTQAEHVYEVHNKNVKCVDVHPVQDQYFVTASADSVVKVWDSRKMTKKRCVSVCSLNHLRSVDSAYFSPMTGNQLLTTSMDDIIRIYNTSVISDNIKERLSKRHFNHTGRWLSNFRAIWHPQREDLFIVGSMTHPRQVEMYSEKGILVKQFRDESYLGSVCSLNAFHPTLDILVGANSSGRLHCFM